METEKWGVIGQFEKPKTSGLQFSTKGNYLVTWEPYQGIYNFSLAYIMSTYDLFVFSHQGHTSQHTKFAHLEFGN